MLCNPEGCLDAHTTTEEACMENSPRSVRRARRVRTALALGTTLTGETESGTNLLELPVLPVRNTVLLPGMVVPLFIDRDAALCAVEEAMEADHTILIVAQRSEHVLDPLPEDVHAVGTQCSITRVLRMPDGTNSV